MLTKGILEPSTNSISSSIITSGDYDSLDSLHKDVAYLNSLLTSHSFSPCPLSYYMEAYPSLTTALRLEVGSLINLAFTLLSTRQKEASFRQDYEARLVRLTEETKTRQIENERLKDGIESREAKLASLNQKLCKSQGRIQELDAAQTELKIELVRTKAAFAIKEKQFSHELRKRDCDFERLKDQLTGSIKESTRVVECAYTEPSGVPVAQSEQVPLEMEPFQRAPQFEPENLSEPPPPYIDRITELESENSNLRHLVSEMSHVLVQLRQVGNSEEVSHEDNEPDCKANDQPNLNLKNETSSRVEGLPVEWMYEQMKEELESSLAIISARLHSVQPYVCDEEF